MNIKIDHKMSIKLKDANKIAIFVLFHPFYCQNYGKYFLTCSIKLTLKIQIVLQTKKTLLKRVILIMCNSK